MKPFEISLRHQMILLPSFEKELIGNILPTTYNVGDRLAVPHRVTETRILNNIGYSVPSPIHYYYNWPNGQGFTPYAAQKETAAFLTHYRRAFVLNQIGMGKSLSALWAMDFMMSQKDINKVLIIAPLSTLRLVWANTIWLNFPHRKFAVLHHPSKQKRLIELQKDVDFYIINIDGIKVMWEELIARTDIDHIIIDELAEFKSGQTDKFKTMDAIIKSGKTVCGMTGAPIPNGPTDAYSQVKLINPSLVPRSFRQFRESTMIKITDFKWIPKEDALQTVHRVMQPAVRFTRDECYELPEATYVDLEVELSKEQQAAYKDMHAKLVTEFSMGEIKAANAAVKMSKLIQIAAGMVLDNNGEAHMLPCSKRLAELVSNIRNADTKVIVFVPFKKMTEMVNDEISKYWTTAVVNGGVSANKRNDIFSDFQGKADPHVLIAHPKCMSHGLTLTEAATIIWYAPYLNTDVYTQANGRITRSPQKNNQFIIHLQGTEIEKRVYQKLRSNQALQGALLDMFSKIL